MEVYLEEWFSAGGKFILKGTFGTVWGYSKVYHLESITGIYCVDVRDPAKYLAMHRTTMSPTKNSPAQNVNSVTVEKLCPKAYA